MLLYLYHTEDYLETKSDFFLVYSCAPCMDNVANIFFNVWALEIDKFSDIFNTTVFFQVLLIVVSMVVV